MTTRKQKGFSQQQLADYLCMNVSSYNRREKGISHIKPDEWMKLADILEVHLDEIYEHDARYHIDCKDQSIGINHGTQKVYTVPKALLDSQQKYIEMLEARIKKLEED
ncbi:helix-turn-helix domain-containing protein [Flavobacteriaceae bacterium 14752]|uniref:helix-turn-helix domain-containing protein n=1 Tax=Mesohalobacter salilacus TaxID=2491711 RepID=UPI000F635286|nr:helix-turn-helix domain-containing protein [Flavobacteriaceae bacterium 14752]